MARAERRQRDKKERKRATALIISQHPPGQCDVIGGVWQGPELGSASDVCCGQTFGRNGRYQTKDLPSLMCSSSLLVWQLSLQEVKGSKLPKGALAPQSTHEQACAQRLLMALLPLE